MEEDFVEDIDVTIKIIVLGNGGVGKSSLAIRFAKDQFSDQYKKTIGVDFLQKRKFIKTVGREVGFHIWDTAGQEYFDSLTRRYYKGAHVALLVFSTTDRESFLSIKKWKEKIIDEIGNKIPMLLIMNKIDAAEVDKVVTEEEANNLAISLEVNLFKASVKNNINIEEIFDKAANDYFSKGMNKNNEVLQDVKDVKKSEIKKEDVKEIGKEPKEEKRGDEGFRISIKQQSNKKPEKKGCC